MKRKVVKTSFEEEQRKKDEAFLKLTPLQRLAFLKKMIEAMKRPEVDYSYDGMTVTVKRVK